MCTWALPTSGSISLSLRSVGCTGPFIASRYTAAHRPDVDDRGSGAPPAGEACRPVDRGAPAPPPRPHGRGQRDLPPRPAVRGLPGRAALRAGDRPRPERLLPVRSQYLAAARWSVLACLGHRGPGRRQPPRTPPQGPTRGHGEDAAPARRGRPPRPRRGAAAALRRPRLADGRDRRRGPGAVARIPVRNARRLLRWDGRLRDLALHRPRDGVPDAALPRADRQHGERRPGELDAAR